MSTVRVPAEDFRVYLGMPVHSAAHGSASMSSSAHALINDPVFKDSFCQIMDRHLQDPAVLSFPLITGKMKLPFDTTGHVSEEVMLAQLTNLLNQSKVKSTDSFTVTGLQVGICIRTPYGWLVPDDFNVDLNGSAWTLAETVDEYIAVRSTSNSQFEAQNLPALNELRSVPVQLCVHYRHQLIGSDSVEGQAGGSPTPPSA